MHFLDKFCGYWFNAVHSNNLVYNTCWEDPRLDRVALELGPEDTILVITSGGCNALDYALCAPKHVYAVDVNPRQNALLELKLAGIRTLDYETFFRLFGKGRLANRKESGEVYRQHLRDALPVFAQKYWDKRVVDYFDGSGWRSSFYFHGTCGFFARMINFYIDRVAKVRDEIVSILSAPSVDEQRAIYDAALRDTFWTGMVRWMMNRDTVLAMLGVPKPQRKQVEMHYDGKMSRFVEDCVEAVFAQLPLSDNYFWRVYLTGEYTQSCCPEYLEPGNFQALKDGLADRVTTHTSTVMDFLNAHPEPISRFVLLDHMDWLSTHARPALVQEWQAIARAAAPQARMIWRSGGLESPDVDSIVVRREDQDARVGELLSYDHDLAAELHPKDRVHTYGSFYIATMTGAPDRE